MEAVFEKALAVLVQHISPVNARSLLLRALHEQRLTPRDLTKQDLSKCSVALRRGVALFVEPERRQAALRTIADLCGEDPTALDPCLLQITTESDIGKARAEARRICDAIGASPFVMQKIATIMSELARNMVLYAGGGVVEMIAMNTGQRRVLIRATDRGRGIPNLEEVMSGKYKSKTGMGRGLLGSKRLADRFDVSTGTAGTRVSLEVFL